MFDKLVDLLVSCIRLFMFWAVVDQYSRGVILRLGKFHRKAEPGFHWVRPFNIESVLQTNVVANTLEIGSQSLTTKDDVQVVITAVITYAISDVQIFLLDVEGGQQAVEDSAYGPIANVVMNHTYAELKAMDLPDKLLKLVRKPAKKYAVDVQQVSVKNFTKAKSLRLIQGV
jgi:regulator of protease activity HflC (stomatin/prohibitin superfamily)